MSAIDWAAVHHFLDLLGKDRRSHLRLFPPKGMDPERTEELKARALRANQPEAVQAAHDEGRGLYGVIGNGGNRDEDIRSIPACFADLDDGTEEHQRERIARGPRPSFIVRTGGRSLHPYFRLAEPAAGADLERWRAAQCLAIAFYGADPKIKNPSRVMRLPGGWYVDAEGNHTAPVEVIEDGGPVYTLDELIQAWTPEGDAAPVEETSPPIAVAPAAPPVASTDASTTEALRQLALLPPYVPGNGQTAPDGSKIRDRYLRALWALGAVLGPDAAGDAFAAHSPAWDASEKRRGGLRGLAAEANGSIPFDTFFKVSKFFGVTRETTKQAGPPSKEITDPWVALRDKADELVRSDWSLRRQRSELRTIAKRHDLGLTPSDLDAELVDAERRLRPQARNFGPGGSFPVSSQTWLVDGLVRHGANLLIGPPGVGKSGCVLALGAHFVHGAPTWLGYTLELPPDPQDRHLLIVGTDQDASDWALILDPLGLGETRDGVFQAHPHVTLWTSDHAVAFDAEGLRRIRRWCDSHPHGLVIADSLDTLVPPGVDPDKRGVRSLLNRWIDAVQGLPSVLLAHTRKSAGKDGQIGVGATAGSTQIDAAFSRVLGMAPLNKKENGVMVPQESDPRRNFVSQKRGGCPVHLVVTRDHTGGWSVVCTGQEMQRQEKVEQAERSLTRGQQAALAALRSDPARFFSVREVVEVLGISWNRESNDVRTVRKNLRSLKSDGLAEDREEGGSTLYRARPFGSGQKEQGGPPGAQAGPPGGTAQAGPSSSSSAIASRAGADIPWSARSAPSGANGFGGIAEWSAKSPHGPHGPHPSVGGREGGDSLFSMRTTPADPADQARTTADQVRTKRGPNGFSQEPAPRLDADHADHADHASFQVGEKREGTPLGGEHEGEGPTCSIGRSPDGQPVPAEGGLPVDANGEGVVTQLLEREAENGVKSAERGPARTGPQKVRSPHESPIGATSAPGPWRKVGLVKDRLPARWYHIERALPDGNTERTEIMACEIYNFGLGSAS